MLAQPQKAKKRLAEMALLLCGVVWGSAFVVMKNSLDAWPVNWLLTLRFLFSGLVMLVFMPGRVIRAGLSTLQVGLLAGVVMYGGYMMQTLGLTTTTAGNSAFITSVYVVLVPFLQWALTRQSPGKRPVIAAALCLAGVGLIAIRPDFSVGVGDLWTLAGGVLFAMGLVLAKRYSTRGIDMLALTCWQFLTVALCAFIAALIFEPAPAFAMLLSTQQLFPLAYLVLVCTVLSIAAQNVAMRYAPAAHASLLLGTEAPFGSLFGILLLGEPFTLRFLAGAALITFAILFSELGDARKPPGKAHAANGQTAHS